jgi:two-component system, CitB family, sensor kinase
MRKLSTQIFASQVAILAATVVVGFALFATGERAQLDRQYERQAASIAWTAAQIPEIRACMTPDATCDGTVQSIASKIVAGTSAAYVVVIDMNRIRHSHPYPDLIGKQIEEPIATLDGRDHVTIDSGSTGRSANGKAPLYAPNGQMVGEISVGIRESSVTEAFWGELPVYALWFGLALAVGAIASWALAARLKRRTYGLELDEIAHLLREREAVLHGIREGMIAFDHDGRVTMVNDEARRLLGLGTARIGGRLDELVPAGRLRDILSGAIDGKDEVILTDDYCLTVNRMPVVLTGRLHGAVVTLRDRTELAGLLRELDSVRGLTDALRAQQHEFANRMHTLAGLLELGETNEALRFLTDLRGAEAEFAESVRARIASPLVVGLILAKAAIATERGVKLELTDDTWLGDVPVKEQALTTILGNLIDNAFDAVSGPGFEPGRPGRVLVSLVEDTDRIGIRVTDNGPGIPVGAATHVFTDGYSTKPSKGSLRRGLGLALVHRLVQRLDGRIFASEGPGAVFTVMLPKEVT